jgi:hypothetical protein
LDREAASKTHWCAIQVQDFVEDGGATDDAEQQFTAEAALSSLHFWDFFKDGLNMLVRSATLQVWWKWSSLPCSARTSQIVSGLKGVS